MSGMIATAVIQPIDTIKVVIQGKGEAAGRNRVGITPLAVAKQILESDGVAGKQWSN